jgi:cell division protein FtsN
MKKALLISALTMVFLLSGGTWYYDRQKGFSFLGESREKKVRVQKKQRAVVKPVSLEEPEDPVDFEKGDGFDYTFFDVLGDLEMKKVVEIRTHPRFIPVQPQASGNNKPAGKGVVVSEAKAVAVTAKLAETRPQVQAEKRSTPQGQEKPESKETSAPVIPATTAKQETALAEDRIASSAQEPVLIKPVVEKPLSKEFTVQISSYQDASHAQHIRNYLGRKGYSPYLVGAEANARNGWYRVYLGKYPDYDTARIVARRVQMEEGLESVVVLLSR